MRKNLGKRCEICGRQLLGNEFKCHACGKVICGGVRVWADRSERVFSDSR